MSLIVDEHRQYLQDTPRIAAFDRAIREMVRSGDTVLDLGCGTGILGMMAMRGGAGKVYSVDDGGMIGVARALGKTNGFAGRQIYFKAHSTRLHLPELVDLVIADQTGRFGFEAGILEYFDDAKRRLLKPGGRLLPSSVDLWVAPVESSKNFDDIEYWKTRPAGFDFMPAWKLSANTGYPVKFKPEQLLADPAHGCSIDLYQDIPSFFRLNAEMKIAKSGVLHGIGGWFSAQLSPSVILTNSPLAPDSINRRNVFFPLTDPVPVKAGDLVQLKMVIQHSELMVSWNVEVFAPTSATPKARFSQSTMAGMLLAHEDLRRTAPNSIPKLNPWGEARRTVLETTDGHTPLSEVERKVFERHPNLFPDPASAAFFVAEVITRYAL